MLWFGVDLLVNLLRSGEQGLGQAWSGKDYLINFLGQVRHGWVMLGEVRQGFISQFQAWHCPARHAAVR